ncbi:MAG: methyl-accepting chemotaxis protein [Roseateles depolymerans]|uniref:Methyl-accepting chemotaxis protein n=1 Tax=Roseateles depolymerans TaxID=76731 RepID=A0A2W5F5Z2_9BURK|nr:MAG: methyl-accepting chemotaxis protein [Roseateles depolymerans]
MSGFLPFCSGRRQDGPRTVRRVTAECRAAGADLLRHACVIQGSGMNLDQWPIGRKIFVAFGVVVALLIVAVATGLGMLHALYDEAELLAQDRSPKLQHAADWRVSLLKSARHLGNLLVLEEPARIAEEVAGLEKQHELRGEAIHYLDQHVVTPQGRASLKALEGDRQHYLASERQLVKLVQAGDIAAARLLMQKETSPAELAYLQRIEEFAATQKKLVEDQAVSADRTYLRGRTILWGLAAAAVLAALMAGAWLVRSVLRQLGGDPREAVATARRIADGDMSQDVQVPPGDDTSLLAAMRDMQLKLRQLVAQVRGGVDSVLTASSQIAAGNQDLSSRTEMQASNLQQTASALEQLTSTVRQSADHAQQANQLAAAASEAAGRGGEVVGQVVSTMREISDSSRRIVDIIGVIDGIAFQTNILALNAAVEAARAGEQGRGFAVVASEVRTLAQRSATAAKEIKALIGGSADRVELGGRQVAEAGEAMEQIVQQVRKVSDLIGEIAHATTEQSQGLVTVNESVTQVDHATQQNAALVEESAAAAASLATQAQQLSGAVAVFRVR